MTTARIYANGTSAVFTIASGSKVAIAVNGENTRATLFYRSPVSGQGWIQQTVVSGSTEYLSSAVSAATDAYIEVTGPDGALYETGTAPVIVNFPTPGLAPVNQGAPTAKTVSATLTAAELLTKLLTVNQGAGAASALQLPTGTALDTALPSFANDDAFMFSIINISTVDAEDASITVNTGVTIVGNADIPAYSAAGSLNSSGRFLLRKTGTATWVCYRIS